MRILFVAAAILLACMSNVTAQTVIRLAVSTVENHPRNQALIRWANFVASQSGNRIVVEILHGEPRYEGSRMLNAVAEGVFDMAVPGWWHVSRFAPNFRISALPIFYGRDKQDIAAIFDGPHGAALDRSLEEALTVNVLGRRIDLGYGQLYFSAKEVKAYKDLSGLNIRVPGGSDDLARYLVFDATPRRIALNDIKSALRNNLIGGLLTTHSFVRDMALWEDGIRYAFLDDQVFYQYTPIFNRARWESLAAEDREILARSWEASVDEMRRSAARAQRESRAIISRNGVVYREPSAEKKLEMRSRLRAEQPALIKALGMNAAFITRVEAALNERDKAKRAR